MSWNVKGASLLALPTQWRGRKVYRVENVGDRPARAIRATLRDGSEDLTACIRARIPETLQPGETFLLAIATPFEDSGVLTLHWAGADGEERRWHGSVCRD